MNFLRAAALTMAVLFFGAFLMDPKILLATLAGIALALFYMGARMGRKK